MQNTLEYTAYNGMKFYIVYAYIEALEKEPEEDSPMMSIVFTTHPEIIAEAKADAECNGGAVPVGCKDLLVDSVDNITRQLDYVAHAVETGDPWYECLKV